jgi:hypothetical protein
MLGQPTLENPQGHARLERPHRVLLRIVHRLAAGAVARGWLPIPRRGVVIVLLDGPVEVAGQAADGGLVADVGLAEAAGREAAHAPGWLDQDDRAPPSPESPP